MIRELETSSVYGGLSETVIGELLRHAFSFAETKVFRHPLDWNQMQVTRKMLFCLSRCLRGAGARGGL